MPWRARAGRVWMPPTRQPDYRRLLTFRTSLRRFERWSEDQARSAGLTPAQHQLLLVSKGHDDERGPTVGQVAEYLMLQHHSAVGLIDRAEAAGFVVRVKDDRDARGMRVRLTHAGDEVLAQLTRLHLEEIRRLAPIVQSLSDGA